MNRRITRVIAGEAADAIAAAKYNEHLSELHQGLSLFAESMIKKYIPYPVRAIALEYPSYFELTSYVLISAVNPANQYGLKFNWLGVETTVQIPKSCKYITVSCEDFLDFKKLYDKYNRVQENKKMFLEDCYKALIAIGSESKLKQDFPAAIPYVKFPEVVQLPSKSYSDLNLAVEMINGVNHE